MAAPGAPLPGETDWVRLEVLLRQRAEGIRRRQLDTASRRLRTSDELILAEVNELLDDVSRTIVEELLAALLGNAGTSTRDAMGARPSAGCAQQIRQAFDLFEFDCAPSGSGDFEAGASEAELDAGSHAD